MIMTGNVMSEQKQGVKTRIKLAAGDKSDDVTMGISCVVFLSRVRIENTAPGGWARGRDFISDKVSHNPSMSRANIDPALSQDHLTPPLPRVVQLKVGLDCDYLTWLVRPPCPSVCYETII